jgi:hypothetical protein
MTDPTLTPPNQYRPKVLTPKQNWWNKSNPNKQIKQEFIPVGQPEETATGNKLKEEVNNTRRQKEEVNIKHYNQWITYNIRDTKMQMIVSEFEMPHQIYIFLLLH